MALTICEDAWNDKHFWNKRLYTVDPVEALVQAGGNFVLNISASPFWMGKREFRREMLATIARQDKVPVALVNQVGGNDSLVFDGSSLVLNSAGEVIAQGKSFEEDLIYFDSDHLTGEMHEQMQGEEASAYAALVLGTRDYVRKCGFRQVIIGLSGGIDSALTACIAADAVGPENVIGVGMPGPYSSSGSIDDARSLAHNLGIRFELLCITDIFESYRKTLQDVFAGRKEDATEENHSGAHPGRVAHGAFQQVRGDRAQHRKQERTGSGILHSLRRHGRRPGGDLGCAQDAGLSPEPLREFAAAGDPASQPGKAALGGVAPRSEGH